MEQQFKAGDRVVCIDAGCTAVSSDKEYIVQGYDQPLNYIKLYRYSTPSTTCWLHAGSFKLADKTPKQLAKEHLGTLVRKKFEISEEYRAAVVAYEHFDKIAALEKAVENALFGWKDSVRVEKMWHQILLREEAKLHNMTYCS